MKYILWLNASSHDLSVNLICRANESVTMQRRLSLAALMYKMIPVLD